jgi:serine/threonine protein kinase
LAPLVQIGEIVEGRYKIVRPIADGGMGMVFLAEHWLIKRKVAMKILHAELVHDATMIRRFMNEALAAGTLGHPHIVESTDMGFTKSNVPYIVFEYLHGTVLADEIRTQRQLHPARAIIIAHQIASALEAAHGAGIIHRDLKSDNIFLTKKGEADHAKVLDFGISRFLTASDRTAVGGNLLGTPEFMAPEQVTAPDTIDHRVDIYALGVLLYEMLMGRVPFVLTKQDDIEAAHALLHRVVGETPPLIAISDPPNGLPELVATLLAKNPDHRPQTMSEVQRALERFGFVRRPRAQTSPRTADPEIADLSDQTVSRSHLSPDEIAREVVQLGKRWSMHDSDLVLELHDREMAELATVVNEVALVADEMELQPRVAIEYPRLRVTLPAVATVADLVFAARVEQWLRDVGW